MLVQGIHHITAISSDAKTTYDFYTKILGLRLVKKSVNQDDVSTYHLFFGNRTGNPGMDLTFFPFRGVPPGKRGNGLVTTISFEVLPGTLKFWKERFKKAGVKHDETVELFGKSRLTFYDNDDQKLEMVEVENISDAYLTSVWETEDITKDHALYCFHSATLSVDSLKTIKPVLDTFGYKSISKEKNLSLYQIPGQESAGYLIIDEAVIEDEPVNGSGTVHHIAFTVKNREEQVQLQLEISKLFLRPTPVIDRYYFTSVYFRTEAGILFEIATEEPGFTADEDPETLGEKLALPPFLEEYREKIEKILPPLKTT